MAQQLHLQRSLLHAHGFHAEAFYTNYPWGIVLVLIIIIFGGLTLVAEGLFKLRFVTNDLLFKLCNNVVNACVHIAGHFFTTDNAACVRNGDFNDVTVLFHGHGHLNHGILGEIAFELCKLLVGKLAQILRNLHVFAAVSYLHT